MPIIVKKKLDKLKRQYTVSYKVISKGECLFIIRF